MRQPPNFAGHCSFVYWGCGTNCMGGAVVDQQTGKVFVPPLTRNAQGDEHWIISGLFFMDKPPIQIRSSSRLMILKREFYGNDGYDPEIFYLVWENEQFREILHTVGGLIIKPKPTLLPDMFGVHPVLLPSNLDSQGLFF